MGVDWIPGVSQLKSAFQLVTGDVEGAAKTQENFLKECPVVSLATSTVQLISGDEKGALETQKRTLGTINNVANGIPVVGHVKGVIHHIVGDHDGGNNALNAATRTTVVLGSGAAAALATGGLGAIPAGLAAGTAYDVLDSTISDKPKGTFAVLVNAIKNTDAGNIFDVAASYVGDGLTGYSGGQIATKISTQVKINKLEVMREAKNEQLNNVMFGEEAGAGGNSGNLVSLGKEINTLTKEINQLQNGNPQYYYDPKKNQVVVEKTNSGAIVLPVRQLQSNEKDESTQRGEINLPMTGLDADMYSGVVQDRLKGNLALAHLQLYSQQTPNKTLTQANRGTIIPSQNQAQILKQNDDPRRIIQSIGSTTILSPIWLHLSMPPEFGYTGAGLLNNGYQGFLHTFLRHWDQWQNHIPGLSQIMKQLDPIKDLLKQVLKAPNPQSARDLINNLINEIQLRYPHLGEVLVEAQLLIYKFMQQNLKFANYLGECVSDNGQIQVLFQVGNEIMVVCVSTELFNPVQVFGDNRPVRSVITVFFMDSIILKNIYSKKTYQKP